MVKNSTIKLLIALSLLFTSLLTQADEKVTVFAAASLTNALTDIGTQYKKEKATKIEIGRAHV